MLGTGLEVDRFSPSAAVAYLAFFGLAMAVRLDRTWTWWLTGVVLAYTLVLASWATTRRCRPPGRWTSSIGSRGRCSPAF